MSSCSNTETDDDEITVYVTNDGDETEVWCMPQHSEFEPFMREYCASRSLDFDATKFYFQGMPLPAYDTPETLCWEESLVLHIHVNTLCSV